MVEKVLTVSQATDVTMEVERHRQAAAMKVCVELLDTSTEHYEHLMLLRDELRKREKPIKQLPPVIEPSGSDIWLVSLTLNNVMFIFKKIYSLFAHKVLQIIIS